MGAAIIPLYYFHIREGDALIRDEEGSDLPDKSAAQTYAIDAARSLLSADVRKGMLPLSHAIEVTDMTGRPVFSVTYGEAVTLI